MRSPGALVEGEGEIPAPPLAVVTEPILLVEGVLKKQDGVVSIKAGRVEALPPLTHNIPSRDFG